MKAQEQQQPTQLPHQQFFPMQPQSALQRGGVARALAFARGLSGTTVILTALVLIAQGAMPPGSKPSDIIGAFHGRTEAAEIAAKQAATVEYEKKLAEARANPPAAAQIETQTAQTQQQVMAGSLATQQEAANLADGACIAGNVLSLFGPDAKDVANALQQGCGAGDAIRRNMNQQLAGAARNGSAVIQRTSP